jgi:hypothetical protein
MCAPFLPLIFSYQSKGAASFAKLQGLASFTLGKLPLRLGLKIDQQVAH